MDKVHAIIDRMQGSVVVQETEENLSKNEDSGVTNRIATSIEVGGLLWGDRSKSNKSLGWTIKSSQQKDGQRSYESSKKNQEHIYCTFLLVDLCREFLYFHLPN